MGCQGLHFAQRAMGLHQCVQRDGALQAVPGAGSVNAGGRPVHIGHAPGLGDHQIGQPRTHTAHQQVHHLLEARMVHGLQAGAHTPETVRR